MKYYIFYYLYAFYVYICFIIMCYKQNKIQNEAKEPLEQYKALRDKLKFYAQLEYERYLMRKKCKTQ